MVFCYSSMVMFICLNGDYTRYLCFAFFVDVSLLWHRFLGVLDIFLVTQVSLYSAPLVMYIRSLSLGMNTLLMAPYLAC